MAPAPVMSAACAGTAARLSRATAAAIPSESKQFQVSVLDVAGTEAMIAEIEREWGAIDILVNNAGVSQAMPLALMEEEDWDRKPTVLRAGKLPKDGLPTWFKELDTDGDGQVALFEWRKAGKNLQHKRSFVSDGPRPMIYCTTITMAVRPMAITA